MPLPALKHLAALGLFCLMSATLPAQSTPPLSDEDVWSFIVYLYGYDDEERLELARLSPEQKANYISNVRGMAEDMNVKNPDDFSPEDRAFFAAMRDSFQQSKMRMRAALNLRHTLNEQDAMRMAGLAQELIEKYRAKPFRTLESYHYANPQRPIPPGWEFLRPLQIRVSNDSVEVQLFVNIYQPNGAQVYIYVLEEDDGDAYRVTYKDNLAPRKSWLVATPKTEKKSSYGPHQNRH